MVPLEAVDDYHIRAESPEKYRHGTILESMMIRLHCSHRAYKRCNLRLHITRPDILTGISVTGKISAGHLNAQGHKLIARELVKGKVLETALMSAREVSDAICEATGADGISCVGNKFVIWRFSEKCQAERNQTGRAKRKETPKSKADPVGKGMRARKAAARKVREQRNEYFRQQAIEKSIEKAREKQLRNED